MRIRAGYEITYECRFPTPMILMLNVRPEREPDLETPDDVRTDPGVPVTQYRDLYGNTCSRLLAPPGRITLTADFVVRDSGEPDPVVADAAQARVEDLPPEVLIYLLGSRYCDTQAMTDLAWKLFGDTPPGWPRVQAIVEYAHKRVEFGYHHARATRTAFEAHEEQCGVCRAGRLQGDHRRTPRARRRAGRAPGGRAPGQRAERAAERVAARLTTARPVPGRSRGAR